MTRRQIASALAAATAAALAATAIPAQGATPVTSSTVSGVLSYAIPAWAHGAPDAAEPAAASVDFVLQLAPRNYAQLKSVAAAVSNPASASYRKFLTPAEYAARYAPTATSENLVTSWVTAHGMQVLGTTRQHSFVEVRGTAASVATAFSTTFGLFSHNGMLLRSPLTAPLMPTALRGVVSSVANLDEETPLAPYISTGDPQPDAAPATAFVNARPCSTYYGQKKAKKQPKYEGAKQKYAVCGYTGPQLAKAYQVNKTHLQGKGATIGIVDAYASPTILGDADRYAKIYGYRGFAKGEYTQSNVPGEGAVPEGPSASSLLLDPQGWYGEETLDVEAVHAMAPRAKVAYQAAVSPYGPMLYMALSQSVDSGKVQAVSNSYGTASDSPDAADLSMFNMITTTAASMGITIDFSSGDSGDETDPSADGARTADFPATSPGVTAVGGTSLHINKKGKRTSETYWGTRKDVYAKGGWDLAKADVVYGGAGGGGVSTTYAEPAWQKGVVPANLTTIGRTTPGRVEPDVSMDADSTTGFLMGQTQTFADGSVKYSQYRIGGTSLSSPLFTGVLALAIGKRNGKGLGLITPTLYAASKHASARKKLFFDPQGVKVDKKTGQSIVANVRPDFTATDDPTSHVQYSLRTLGNLATLHRYRGYDDSTGLGVPMVPALIKKLLKST